MNRLLFVILVAGFGCGGDDDPSPSAACEDLASVTCRQLYACLTEAERSAAGLPATEAECVTQNEADFSCSTQTTENTCDVGQTYHGDKASECIDQVDHMTCDDVRSGDFDAAAPACSEVCT